MQEQKIIQHITQWLENYLMKSRQHGFVLGVSGGIDSAVTSTLCAQTGKDVLLLDIPIHQKNDQLARSAEHIQWLQNQYPNVSSKKVDLTATFNALANAVEATMDDEQTQLSLANTRSRLRMASLYYYAGLHRYLVVGTGNKVEDFGVGFFTKYGDGGVDISPIADLMKSQVFAIANELNIIESIQQAKPTDGLWDDDRSDEDQMGASYEELEWAMSVYNKDSKQGFSTRESEVYEIYHRLHQSMQHKINPIPVCEIPAEYT